LFSWRPFFVMLSVSAMIVQLSQSTCLLSQ